MILLIKHLKNQARKQMSHPVIGWNSIKYLLVELFIVFAGVYGAFILSTYNQEQKQKADQQKVFVALHNEISDLSKLFGGIAAYHDKFNETIKQKLANNEAPTEIENFRYASPQYSLEVLESALRFNSFETLDLPLHIQLSQYHSDIQKLIYTEQKITEMSEDYVMLYNAGPEVWRRQYKWSLTYLEDRRIILRKLATNSEEILLEINQRIKNQNGSTGAESREE